MKFSASVKRIDHGYRQMQADFKKLDQGKLYVKAGVLGSTEKREDGKLTNAQLAIWLNYGTSKMPARPFIHPAFEAHRHEYIQILRKLVAGKAYRESFDYHRVLSIIGVKMASDMKKFVTQGPEVAPTNAPSTKRRKQALNAVRGGGKAQGDTRTLVDTGRLVASISYAVLERDVIKAAGFVGGHAEDRVRTTKQKFTKGHAGDR